MNTYSVWVYYTQQMEVLVDAETKEDAYRKVYIDNSWEDVRLGSVEEASLSDVDLEAAVRPHNFEKVSE